MERNPDLIGSNHGSNYYHRSNRAYSLRTSLMTSDEFRGFIANFIIDGSVITALAIMNLHWPLWGYALIGLGLFMIAPIVGYHPKPESKRERED